MKVSVQLIVALWAAMSCSRVEAGQDKRDVATIDSELSRAAAAQLERLASFPRSGLLQDTSSSSSSSSSSFSSTSTPAKPSKQDTRSTRASPKRPSLTSSADGDELQLRIPIDFTELFRIFSDASSTSEDTSTRDKRKNPSVQLTPDRMKALDRYADKLMQDERVQSYVRERIKRDGGYGGYGSGGGKTLDSSGAFISGLAGQLVGSVIGLSSSASRTSSSSSSHGHSPAPVYGPPPPVYHTYGHKESVSVWDIKKAILNTLIQAVKAISGGVLALKGQLIKGSGFLVSTKGRIITSAGDTISSLGKSLASSAVVQAPPQHHHHTYPSYGHVGYGYETPHVIAHDSQYTGPPPPSHDSYHSGFAAASDDVNLQPGLIIAKPTSDSTSDIQSDHHDTSQLQTHHYQPEDIPSEHVQTEHQQNDYTSANNVEFPKINANNLKGVVGHLKGTLDLYQTDDAKGPETQAVDEIPSIPGNSLQLQDHNQENYELYPPLGNGPPDNQNTAQEPSKYEQQVNFKNPVNNPQKYEYSPESYQNTYESPQSSYGIPNANLYNYLPSKPHSPDIQIEISNQDITGFETGGFARFRKTPGLHVVTMQEPLKIPILGPNTIKHYKRAVYPPPISINPMIGFSKYPRYGPGFEIQQSVEYKLRNRRDGSLNYIHRI